MPLSTSRIIGLTGGIACGKSTVSRYLEQHHHCTILDADLYAREAVSYPSILLEQIRERYGDEIIGLDQELDRPKLGHLIFNDDHERRWLEQLIHPYIRQQLEQERTRYLHQHSHAPSIPPLVMVIPLLFESHMEDLVTETWVVSCSPLQQEQRLVDRNSLSVAQAHARIKSQWPLEEKIKRASIILTNTGDRPQLYLQIDSAMGQNIQS